MLRSVYHAAQVRTRISESNQGKRPITARHTDSRKPVYEGLAVTNKMCGGGLQRVDTGCLA